MFSFTPKSDAEIQEIQNRDLLPDGTYKAIIRECEPAVSEAQNKMLKVRIWIDEKEEFQRNIFDQIVVLDTMIYRLKNFCEAIGFEEEYKKGSFDTNLCKDIKCLVVIGTQKGKARPDGGFYRDKNVVKSYLKMEQKEQPKQEEHFDTDLPF